MRSTLAIGDEIEIPFVHAEFIPAIVEEFKKPIEERSFNRDQFSEGGGR
jgi:hypothetical protein